jgi:hypothetical protein
MSVDLACDLCGTIFEEDGDVYEVSSSYTTIPMDGNMSVEEAFEKFLTAGDGEEEGKEPDGKFCSEKCAQKWILQKARGDFATEPSLKSIH